MLKFAIFALLLLNFHQISAENQIVSTGPSADEDREADITSAKRYFNDNWASVQQYVWRHGAAIEGQLEALSSLDSLFENPRHTYSSHVELCLEDQSFPERKSSELSHWNVTLFSEYDQFFKVLDEIPRFEMNWTKLKLGAFTQYGEYRQMEVARDVAVFTQNFLCLQNLRDVGKPRKEFETLYSLYLFSKKAVADCVAQRQKQEKKAQNQMWMLAGCVFCAVIIYSCCTRKPKSEN